MTDAELAVRADHRVGEGPLWHPEEACLYWVDIPTGRLFRHVVAGAGSDGAGGADEVDVADGADEVDRADGPDEVDDADAPSTTDQSEPDGSDGSGAPREVLSLDRALGGATLQADGTIALFCGRGGVAVWDGTDVHWVIDELPGETRSRFNDVVADPEGRVFAGTMPTDDGPGTLYRVDPDGTVAVADDRGFEIPNGMDFAPELDALYVTESDARRIYRYEYDRATGELGDRTVFATVPDGEGSVDGRDPVPDGLAVDDEGYVWSARWDGHAVVRHAPDGTVVDRIELPAPKVSAPAFGGEECSDLYITTAKGHDAEDPVPAGSVFRVRPGVEGRPAFRSRIGLDE